LIARRCGKRRKTKIIRRRGSTMTIHANRLPVAPPFRARSRLLSSAVLLIAGASLAQPAFAAAAAAQPSDTANAIVITGTREQSTAIKRNSKVVLDVRSEQEIKSLPDVNAAEALQRLPGVSLETDSGEGRFVNIRGMDADLNGTTFDGVRLTASNPSTPQGGARAVAFDAFPAGILGGVEVIKSLSPEMDAEGLGGVVNIVPRSIASNQHMLIDGTIGGGVETLRGNPRYTGDITVGSGLGGKTESGQNRTELILSYAYDEDKRGIDDVEADYINDPTVAPAGTSAYLTSKLYDDLQPRWYEYHRIRQGAAASVVFRPNDDSTIFVRGLHAGYAEGAHKHEFQLRNLADNIVSVDNATGDVTSADARIRQVAISTRERLGNNLLEAGGSTLFGNIKASLRGAYTRGYDTFPFSENAHWEQRGVTVTYNDTANFNVPTFSGVGTNLQDPARYTRFAGSNGPGHNVDKEWSGVLNFAVPVGSGGSNGEVKFGGSVRARNRIAHAYNADMIDPGTSYAALGTGPEDIFYGGAYDIGPAPSFGLITSIAQEPLTEDLTAFENDDENVYAGYGQYDGTFGPLSVIWGARFEQTDATYRANVETTNDDTGEDLITPNTAKRKYFNVFPDVNLRLQASKELVLRAAFTTAIARPGFNQITAAQGVNLTDFIISKSNPSLKPTTGDNVDLAAELYTPMGGLLSVGLFYKAFQNYILGTVQRDVADPRFGTDPDTGLPNTGELDSYQNIGSAHVQGVEFNVHQPFYFLPAPLNGFGFDGNVTLVDSSGLVHQLDTQPGHLPQTSPFNFNASLYYEKGPISARVAATYVSRNLWAVGDDASTDLYSQPRFRLDVSAAYAVTRQLQIFAEGKNLTNTKFEFTQTADKRYPVQREYYDMDVLGGVRFNFGH
jgi:TonB-dependent receptor